MKKAPRNYSQDLDRRRQGLDAIVGKLDSIPDPTTDDEGKVLKVDDEGNYSLLPDGGAQTMTVAITYDSEQEEYSADKTHAEIVAAIAAGVIVTATYDGRTYVYAGKNDPSGYDAVYFSYLQADSEDQFIGKIFEIDEDDRIVFSEHDLNNDKVLPAVTSSDNGKVLGVVGGVWDKMSLTGRIVRVKAFYNTAQGYAPCLVDKTLGDILSIISNGDLPILEITNPAGTTSNGIFFHLVTGATSATFVRNYIDGNGKLNHQEVRFSGDASTIQSTIVIFKTEAYTAPTT